MRSFSHIAFLAFGLLMVAGCFVVAHLAPQLTYGTPAEQRPLITFISIYAAIGAAYLAMLHLLPRLGGGRGLLVGVFIVGVAMRLAMLGTPPILEDDHHRYLWDGAVTASGHNPYRLAPDDVPRPPAADPLASLTADPAAAATLEQIDHGRYTTIYPPVAQAAFAAASVLGPFSIDAWRAVVLIFDLATLAVLLLVMRRLKLPPTAAAVYWLCPLIVIELVQRLHMDVLLGPLLVAAIAAAVGHRTRLTAITLGLAAGVKLWPVLLAPLLLRSRHVHRTALLAGCILAGAIAAIMTAPLLLTDGSAESAGLVAYASHWHNNSALYTLLGWLLQPLAWLLPIEPAHAHYLARPLLGLAWLAWLAWLMRSPADSASQTVLRAFAAIAALFLLSPAQFPWYLTWLLAPAALAWPLANAHDRRVIAATLLYVATLPMYYLTYDHPAAVFAVHLPPWIAITITLLWPKPQSSHRPQPVISAASASSSPR